MYCLQHAPLVKIYPVNETLHDTMANGSAVFIVLLSLSFLCVSCVFQHTRYTIVLDQKETECFTFKWETLNLFNHGCGG